MEEQKTVSVEMIRVGERSRQDLGDIPSLAESIQRIGLLHPILVTPDGLLVAGERRLAAVKVLGWEQVPVRTVDGLDDAISLLLAERDENVCRENLLPSEAVALGEKLEVLEKPKADERKTATQAKRGDRVGAGNLPPPGIYACATCGQEYNRRVWHCPGCGRHPLAQDRYCSTCHHPAPPDERGRVTEKASAAVGMGRRTYEKAKAVVDAAKEAPGQFGALAAEMDRTGKVDRAYKQLRRQRQRQRLIAEAAKVELPHEADLRTGDFREVLADIPGASVDLIFSDPPDDEGCLPLYGDLAEVGARVLKPGGSLLCYASHHALPAILDLMCPHLRYWWTICVRCKGPSTRLPGTRITAQWRPLLWLVKGAHPSEDTRLADLVERDRLRGLRKAHDWHEREAPAAHCIEGLTRAGQVVLDPFLGTGTTLLASLRLKRIGIGVELDPDRAAMASARVGGLLTALRGTWPSRREGIRQRPLTRSQA